jgi:hypothetical protein
MRRALLALLCLLHSITILGTHLLPLPLAGVPLYTYFAPSLPSLIPPSNSPPPPTHFYLSLIADADGTFFTSGGNRDDYTPPDLSSLEQFKVPTSGGAQGGLDPRTARISLRIVGGYEAVPGMFPWLANENRECGATLISRELPLARHTIRTTSLYAVPTPTF